MLDGTHAAKDEQGGFLKCVAEDSQLSCKRGSEHGVRPSGMV